MDVFKDVIAPIVGWIIIIVGWIVVAKINRRNEVRKDIRSVINDIRKVVVDVQARAFEYYRLPQDKGHEAGLLLKQQVAHVAMLANSLTRQNPKFDVSAAMVDFRSKVTGGDFESILRQARPANDPLMAEIAMAGHQFLDDLEAAFSRVYSGG